MSQYEGRQWMVDPECPLVGQAPPCRKPDRRDQARFEALNRAGSGWEIVRETLKRPWSTGSESLSRSRPTSPSWSATDPQPAVVTGPGCYQLAVQHSGPLTEDAERMTKLQIRICGAQFDDWATSRTNRRSCAARRSSGSGVPDDSVGIAVRVRRAAEVISGRSMGGRRWQIAGG